MSLETSLKLLSAQRERCTKCGVCSMECELLNTLTPLTMWRLIDRFGDVLGCTGIDEAPVAQVFAANLDMTTFIHRCSLCGECTLSCPAGNDASSIVTAIRELERCCGTAQDEPPARVLVDSDDNMYTAHRTAAGIDYADLPHPIDKQGSTLFFPGCVLATYAADLCRDTFAWIQVTEPDILFEESCCGAPLQAAGLADRRCVHLHTLAARWKAAEVKRVICACPHCLEDLQAEPNMRDIRFCALPTTMLDAGLEVRGDKLGRHPELLTLFDSCHDRPQRFGKPLRQLMQNYRFQDLVRSGKRARCCGVNSAINSIDRRLMERRANRIITDANTVDATLMVTSCPLCTQHLISMKKMLGMSAGKPQIMHYLELFFKHSFDWESAIDDLSGDTKEPYRSGNVRVSIHMEENAIALRRANR